MSTIHNLQQGIQNAIPSENLAAAILTKFGFNVLNVTSNKKMDLICTSPTTNKQYLVEVKNNYHNNDKLWLERTNSLALGLYSGWMYTSKADYILFISTDSVEPDTYKKQVIIADFKKLQEAFLKVIDLRADFDESVFKHRFSIQPNVNDGDSYNSAAYCLPIAVLEQYGAKLKVRTVQELLTSVPAQLPATPVKSRSEPAQQPEPEQQSLIQSNWLDRLYDGFLEKADADKLAQMNQQLTK